jgi:hypothetical protein
VDKFAAAAAMRKPVSDLELRAKRLARKALRRGTTGLLPTAAAKVQAALDTATSQRGVDYAAHMTAREWLRLNDPNHGKRKPREPQQGETAYPLQPGEMYWSERHQCYKMV